MARRHSRTVERRDATAGRPPLELVRSSRRRKSASAHARDGVIVVQLPAGMPTDEEERIIGRLVDKVTGAARAAAFGGDDALAERAAELADTYLDGVRPSSIEWSGRMRRRFGSCTPADGSVRISRVLASYPAYVRDYVIVHELAHLVYADHSSAFHALVARYPDAERARGFLDGVTFADGRRHLDGGDPVDDLA